MKGFFQATTLLGVLFFGQQALAQDSVLWPVAPATPAKESKQEISQTSRQKNPFYIPRFSIEKVVQQLSYQDSRNQGLNYSPRNNPESSDELRDFVIENSALKRVYEISKDNKPFQLYSGRITLTLSSSRQNFSQGNAFQGNQFYVIRKKNSPVYGLIRLLGKIRKK